MPPRGRRSRRAPGRRESSRPRSRAASATPTAATLLTAKIAVGGSPKLEELQRRRKRALRVDRSRGGDQLEPDLDPGRLERLPVAQDAIARRRDIGRLGDDPDPAVSEPDQVIDERPGSGDAVALHEVAVVPRDRAVDEDERQLVSPERP